MSKYFPASHVPLFDRLQGNFEASVDGRILDLNGLRTSVFLDLSRLFNVRNSLTIEQFLETDLTVLHYGIPDLLSLTTQSDSDLELLSQILRRSIEYFEPRLFDLRIKCQRSKQSLNAASVEILANAYLGQQVCRISFDMSLDPNTAVIH